MPAAILELGGTNAYEYPYMPPLVTIGIPCYNAEDWIETCVTSALEQTHGNVEVIVVDDGSEDASLRTLEIFGDRIRVVRNYHQGATVARNIALREASEESEWIQFLDADDYLQPAKIACQIEEAGDALATADVLYSPVLSEKWDGSDLLDTTSDPINSRLDIYSQWILWQLPQTGGALWRKSALERLDGWNPTQPCCQEHELYLRAIQMDLTFHFTPTAHAVYRLWSEGTLCRKDPRRTIRVRTELIDKMAEWMQQLDLWKNHHRRAAGRAFFEMARTLATRDIDEGIAYYDERRAQNLIHVAGPAAPLRYRVLYWLLGFERAERIALSRR